MHARTPWTELHVKFEVHADLYLTESASIHHRTMDREINVAREICFYGWVGELEDRGTDLRRRREWGLGSPCAATSIVWRHGRRRPAPGHWRRRQGGARARQNRYRIV